jgi:3D (Asp-Asp-Asp) domain-containing protein
VIAQPVARLASYRVIDGSAELMGELDPVSGTLASASAAGRAPRRVATLRMEVTAYCPCTKCCGPLAQGVTASGRLVSHNAGKFVAADTGILKFGTRLEIPGYHDARPVEVIDRGGAIKGYKLDVYFPTHEEALLWGRKMLDVNVVE